MELILVYVVGAAVAVGLAKFLNPMHKVEIKPFNKGVCFDGFEIVCSVDIDYLG